MVLRQRFSVSCAIGCGCIMAVCALTAGCGGGIQEHHLSGNVTYKHQPVPAGNIIFEPDVTKGNTGSPGMCKIKDGKYDTRSEGGHGTIGGPHIVRIVGIDGKPSGDARGEILQGKPLFPEYSVSQDLPKEDGTKDFDVPAT
jgi:hypothetical protein